MYPHTFHYEFQWRYLNHALVIFHKALTGYENPADYYFKIFLHAMIHELLHMRSDRKIWSVRSNEVMMSAHISYKSLIWLLWSINCPEIFRIFRIFRIFLKNFLLFFKIQKSIWFLKKNYCWNGSIHSTILDSYAYRLRRIDPGSSQ